MSLNVAQSDNLASNAPLKVLPIGQSFSLTLCQFTATSRKLQTCLYFASEQSVADFNSLWYTGTRKSFKLPVGLYPRSHRF